MGISYRIDKADRLITATGVGDVSFQDYRGVLAVMIEDPEFDPDFDRLWDMREGHPTLSGDEVRGIAKVVSKVVGGRRAAIVAPGDVAYGLARMYSVFLEDAGIDVQPFRTLDEATAWLRTPAAPSFVPSEVTAA
jgi:hypothetical protein